MKKILILNAKISAAPLVGSAVIIVWPLDPIAEQKNTLAKLRFFGFPVVGYLRAGKCIFITAIQLKRTIK